MRSGKVEICGVNTSSLAVLSAKETEALLAAAAGGDKAAREKLIAGNLKLVLSIVGRFGTRDNPDDLFQVGCIGLIKAIDHFDLSHGVRFSTYAVPMIIGELRRYLRDNTAIRVSRSTRDLAYKALGTRERLAASLGREPRIEEIAGALGVPKEEITVALDAIVDPVSLYEPIYSENGDAVYIMDKVCDDKNTDESWLENIALSDAIGKLSEREKKIIMLRFFRGRTQMEVAREIDISQAQVSRLEKGALERIRAELA